MKRMRIIVVVSACAVTLAAGCRKPVHFPAVSDDQAAAGFGCHGEQVVEPADLPAALERALASGKPACVNVMTDGSVIAPITLAMVGSLNQSSEQAPAEGAAAEGGEDESIQIPYYEDLKE